MTYQFTAMIYPEAMPDGEVLFTAFCPEIDVASQGATVEEARAMLQESIDGLIEVGGAAEIERRLEKGRNAGARVAMLEVAA